jgi:type I restriction enzyme S subunit
MSAELLLHEFDRIGDAPDAVASLRRFLLELAVRGRLSPQQPTDTSARNLLSDLAGPGHRHQEPDKSLQPFTIPASWCWATVSDVFEHQLGKMLNTAKMKGVGRRYLRSVNIRKDGSIALTDLNEMLLPETEFDKYSVKYGDVFVVEGGDVGRNAMWRDQSGEPLAFQNQLHRLRVRLPFDGRFFQLTIEHARQTGLLLDLAAGVTIKHLSATSLRSLPVPVPPMEEQRRIVSTFDGLMKLCDQLELAQKERELQRDALRALTLHGLSLDRDVADRQTGVRLFLGTLPRLITKTAHVAPIRQTILDLAVRGRLVAQDPGDEPTAELLHRLRTSANGRSADSPKPQSEPFQLPVGWEWVHFPDIGKFGRGKSKHRPRNDPVLYVGGVHPFIQTGDVARSGGLIRTFMTMYNDTGLAQSQMWPAGTLCITIAANIADSGILTFDACFPDSVVGLIVSSEFPNCRYFEYFLRTAKADLFSFAPSTAQKNINLSILGDLMIPLPPIEELKRIVAKVDELMAVCDELRTALESAQHERGRLLEALLHDALSGSHPA